SHHVRPNRRTPAADDQESLGPHAPLLDRRSRGDPRPACEPGRSGPGGRERLLRPCLRACGHARVPLVTVKPAAIPALAELISGRPTPASGQSPTAPTRSPSCATPS